MSNFGAKLAELLERHKMRASELSRASGITEALISRWINGVQVFVANEDLVTLVVTLPLRPAERAELIRSHLQDEMGTAPGHELIDISIRNEQTAAREASATNRVALPLKLQRAFDLLMQESLTDADVKSVVIGLANTLDRLPHLAGEDKLTTSEKTIVKIVKSAGRASPK